MKIYFRRARVAAALLLSLSVTALAAAHTIPNPGDPPPAAPEFARRVDTVLIPTGAAWKYLDNGSNQGTEWREPGFNDSAWATGNAQLGYGDGDEATVVSYGPNASSKFITTYFRRTFIVTDPNDFIAVALRLLVDDGAIAYINGTEVFRRNLPSGTITNQTLASSTIGGADESVYHEQLLTSTTLAAGSNVLAVEVHQSAANSSDLSFNLQLIGLDEIAVVRGPYLQMGSHDRMTVRWRTNLPTNSRVRFGDAPGNLTSTADDEAVTTEHIVALTGLSPATIYYYSVGTTAEEIAGNDANHSFRTSPVAGAKAPFRIWALGDSGTANANAAAVRDAFDEVNGSAAVDLMMMLGDNAYFIGTDGEYQAAVFDMYPAHLRRSPLWPTIGNHDGATADSATESGPYYDIFTLPRAAEAGGIASETEAYYSFDFGNVHFICLDSFETNRSPGGSMMTWLASDLNATTQDWIIAFWHHPPYSKGSHNSDTESQLIDMRQNALPLLESRGVDLVLTGHSHSYERSFLLDGHYGLSSTLTQAMILDGGDGRGDGDGAYAKRAIGPDPHQGAVHVVAGSSGQISGGALNHPAMFLSLNELGSLIIDINDNRLDVKFINNNAIVRDYFTITKGEDSSVIDWHGWAFQ